MIISVNMVIIIFCNKPFKAFLESQMSNDKHTPVLPIKKTTCLMWQHTVIFFCTVFIQV